MPKCPYCGSEVSYSDINCPKCGRLLPENEYDDVGYDEKKYAKGFQYRRPTHLGRYIFLIALILFLVLPQAAPYREKAKGYVENPASLWGDINAKYTKVAASATYKMERRMTVRASEGDINFNLRIAIPQDVSAEDGHAIQQVRGINISYPSGTTLEKSGGWMYFNGTVQSGGAATITVTYTMETHTYEWDMLSSKNSGTVSQIPQSYKDRYNHDEYIDDGGKRRDLIEVNAVKDMAEQVTAGRTNVYDKVRAIYDFVTDNIAYQVGSDPKSCDQTLNGKVGDCDDMVILFSAMCRAIGIPAFPGYGFLSNQNLDGWGGHSWANVVVPDKNGNIYTPHVDLPNRMFMWYSPYRLIEWNDDGNSTHLSDFYYLIHYTGSGSGSFSQTFTRIAYHTEGEKLIRVD